MELIYLIIGFIGLFFSIIFSSSEIALISSNKLQIDVWIRQKYKFSKLTKHILENKISFITVSLIGTTLSNILAASYFTVYIGESLPSELIFIPISIIILIFGEIIPKTLIRDYSNIMLLILSPVLTFFYYIFYPAVIIVNKFEFVGKKKFYLNQRDMTNEKIKEFEHAFEQIEDEEQIEDDQKEIISNIFDYRDSIANDIMIPRDEISAISIDSNLDELAHLFIDSGHSKLPVYDKDLDNIRGVVYLYDLYSKPNDLNDIIRKIEFMPYSKPISDIMTHFKNNKESIAIILNKEGKTAGVITIEDIFEELFGDFEDEFDYEKFKSTTLNDNSILVNAKMSIEDFNKEFNNLIPLGDYETISGYIINQIGRIPHKNEHIFLPIGQIRIKKASSRRIEQVQIFKN